MRGLWTPEEDALLWAGLAKGQSYALIASQLGRTIGGVRARHRVTSPTPGLTASQTPVDRLSQIRAENHRRTALAHQRAIGGAVAWEPTCAR